MDRAQYLRLKIAFIERHQVYLSLSSTDHMKVRSCVVLHEARNYERREQLKCNYS